MASYEPKQKLKSVKYWFNVDPDEVHLFKNFNDRRFYTKTGIQAAST